MTFAEAVVVAGADPGKAVVYLILAPGSSVFMGYAWGAPVRLHPAKVKTGRTIYAPPPPQDYGEAITFLPETSPQASLWNWAELSGDWAVLTTWPAWCKHRDELLK